MVRTLWPTEPINYVAIGTAETARAIADLLGCELSPADLAAVNQRHQRESASFALNQVDWQAADAIYRDERYTFHKDSLLHRTHFSDPDMAAPRFELTPERQERLAQLEAGYAASGLPTNAQFFSPID